MAIDASLNPLLAELKPDELLLWTGKPNPERYSVRQRKEAAYFFTGGAIGMWLLGLLSWGFDGFGSQSITFFVAGLIPLSFSIVSSQQRYAPKWWFAVTDQRIFTDYPTDGPKIIWQLPLVKIHKIALQRHTKGCGTIQFNRTFAGQSCVPFECIDNAEHVYKIIEDARAALLPDPAMQNITTLYRPVGAHELKLIADSGYRAFPPRLVDQPIFYPVMNFEYAEQIARDWNTKRNSFAGFVTKFDVEADYLQQFPIQIVGGQQHAELWVPAEKLEEFNSHIIGQIAVAASYYGEQFAGEIDPQTNLPADL